jgi:hypothetical protein
LILHFFCDKLLKTNLQGDTNYVLS